MNQRELTDWAELVQDVFKRQRIVVRDWDQLTMATLDTVLRGRDRQLHIEWCGIDSLDRHAILATLRKAGTFLRDMNQGVS